MNNEKNSVGYLVVRATAANGAIPISGATVLISSYHGGAVGMPDDGAADDIFYALTTDRDGMTERVPLPSMPLELSLKPAEKAENDGNFGDNHNIESEKPYKMYNIETTADGYRSVKNIGAPIYPNVTSVQTVNMTPLEGGVPPPSGFVTYNESEPPNL